MFWQKNSIEDIFERDNSKDGRVSVLLGRNTDLDEYVLLLRRILNDATVVNR